MAELIVEPESVNAILGSTVTFTCVGFNGIIFVWLVNGISNILKESLDRGVDVSSDESINPQKSVLTIPAYPSNDNVSIQCILSSFFKNAGPTPPVFLRIQGPLSPVQDLFYSFIDASTVNISWNSPFTLPGTDIIGYNISVMAGNRTAMDYFTPDNYYVLPLTNISNSSCTEISITVAGYNGLQGETNSLLEIYLPDAGTVNVLPINVEIIQDQLLIITVNVTHLCVGQQPTYADVDLYEGTEFTAHFGDVPLVVDALDNDILSANVSLQEDKRYSVLLSIGNLAGKSGNSMYNLSTHGVQSFTITNSPGHDNRVCLECLFDPLSTDSGCTVELVSTNSTVVANYVKEFNRFNDIAKGCILDVKGGQYVIKVYDAGSTVIAVDEVTLFVAANVVHDQPLWTAVPTSTSIANHMTATTTTSTSPSAFSIPPQAHGKSYTILIAAVAAPLICLLLVIGVIVLIGLMKIIYYKISNKKGTTTTTPAADVTLSQNQAYGEFRATLNGQCILDIKNNPSYESVKPSGSKDHIYEDIIHN